MHLVPRKKNRNKTNKKARYSGTDRGVGSKKQGGETTMVMDAQGWG